MAADLQPEQARLLEWISPRQWADIERLLRYMRESGGRGILTIEVRKGRIWRIAGGPSYQYDQRS